MYQNKKQLQALAARGAQYLSVQKHASNGVSAHAVLGWHKSLTAARNKAGSSDYTTVIDIQDAIDNCYESIITMNKIYSVSYEVFCPYTCLHYRYLAHNIARISVEPYPPGGYLLIMRNAKGQIVAGPLLEDVIKWSIVK